jgi:hypothetical protein
MHRILVALGSFIFFIACCSPSFSFGVIEVCSRDPSTFSTAINQHTVDEAKKLAQEKFAFGRCEYPEFFTFGNECMALVLAPPDQDGRSYFVLKGSTQELAISSARRACASQLGPGCVTVTSVCDRISLVKPPAAVDLSVGRNEQSTPPVYTKPPEPAKPPTDTKLVEAIHTSPDSWLSTLHDYRRSAFEDVQSSIDIEDVKTVALIAATLVVFALVALQLISLVRTGQRRARDLVFQAVIGAVFVCAGTLAWFITVYTTKKLIAFGGTLSPAGKMLFGSTAIGVVLLALPYSFWRMLGDISTHLPKLRQILPRQTSRPKSSSGFADNSTATETTSAPEYANLLPVLQTAPKTIELSQDTSPQEPIVLRLRRSQKHGFLGLRYVLDARIDVSAEIRGLIDKHKLFKKVIYESDARKQRASNVQGYLASNEAVSLFAPPREHVLSLWFLVRAIFSAAWASLALRITVSSLMAGVHVVCKSMEELLEAEDAIRSAKGALEGYIHEISKFDGTEEII